MKTFIGRKAEIQKLTDLSRQKRPVLVVVKGRRRIGKSRLIQEFAKDKIFLPFSGLAPIDNINAQDQRNAFAHQLSQHFNIPPFQLLDWSDAFAHLSKQLTHKPTVILFDEISWMGAKDPTFIPKLKVWWDITLQHYENIMLVFCGSVSTWIEENIVNSTAFFGRVSLHLELAELTLPESNLFLRNNGFKGSDYDKFKLLSVIGGVPWYLEQISSHYTADDNLKHLCFDKNGILVEEFNRIFHDLFLGKGDIYKKIIHTLAQGMRDLATLRSDLDYAKSGSLSHHMNTLIVSGYVSQHYSWSFKTGDLGKRSYYRLSDNYLRFFIKYIEPNLRKIEKNAYKDLSLTALPGWEAMMGYQVENLILKNRTLLLKALNILPSDVVADNPYIQRATAGKRGCQIDYLIQTQTSNLFICEFKFKRRELGLEVIDEVKEKINRLVIPHRFGAVPVLLHLGGVSDKVYDTNYFYRIIDIADFLDIGERNELS
jgi:uncharacterized protein